MSEVDYVVRELKLKEKAIIDIKELYNMLKDWFDLKKFYLLEKDYSDITKEDKKDIKIKWDASKKVDEYNLFEIGVSIKLKDHKVVEVKKGNKTHKMSDCVLEISFDSDIKRDYEEKWEDKPFRKFIRGLQDKFMNQDRDAKIKEELKELTYELFNETKAFLNLQRF
jgi:hypothetical protein